MNQEGIVLYDDKGGRGAVGSINSVNPGTQEGSRRTQHESRAESIKASADEIRSKIRSLAQQRMDDISQPEVTPFIRNNRTNIDQRISKAELARKIFESDLLDNIPDEVMMLVAQPEFAVQVRNPDEMYFAQVSRIARLIISERLMIYRDINTHGEEGFLLMPWDGTEGTSERPECPSLLIYNSLACERANQASRFASRERNIPIKPEVAINGKLDEENWSIFVKQENADSHL